MQFLETLERRYGFLAIRNLTKYLIAGQVLTFLMMWMKGQDAFEVLQHMVFYFQGFAQGQVWRIVSFLLIPLPAHPIFIIFVWMFYYMMGNALEQHWGAFRYNLFLLTGVVCVLVVGAIFPLYAIQNYYLLLSISFAFALLYPDYQILLFLIIPLKMKWAALIAAVFVAIALVAGPTAADRLTILASLANLPIFFGPGLLRTAKARRRVQAIKTEREKFESEPFHVCTRCGATDLTHPDREFRYSEGGAICSECSKG